MHEIDLFHEHLALTDQDRAEMAQYIWDQEHVDLTTIGIDIGSSTSHLLFARVLLERQTQRLSSRFTVVHRQVLWRSPIMLTPFLPDGTPIEAWAHTLGVSVHRGIGAASPNQDVQAAFGGCCGYDVTLATDGATGQPEATWYTGAAGHAGYYVQGIDPATGAPVGAPALVPGSAIAGNSAEPRARAALTGRPGRPGWSG